MQNNAGMNASGLNLEAGGIAPLPDLFSAGGQQGGQTMTDLFTGSMMGGAATPGSINAAPQDPSASTPDTMGVGGASFQTPATAPAKATDSGATPAAAKTPKASSADKGKEAVLHLAILCYCCVCRKLHVCVCVFVCV